MIDIATLKEYINVLEESGLQAIDLSDGNDSIRLEKPAAAAAAIAVQVIARAFPVRVASAIAATAAAPRAMHRTRMRVPFFARFSLFRMASSVRNCFMGTVLRQWICLCYI